MTTSNCYITMVGLARHDGPANSAAFRDALPPSRPGHYWAPALEAFAKAHRLTVCYPLDNLTPQITLGGPELKLLLVDAYGEDHPFLGQAAPYLSQVHRYRVYAEDF